jgi:competence protein ComEC
VTSLPRATPARRPLLACALALLAGSLLGASGPPAPTAWVLAAAGAAGACLGARGYGRAGLGAGLAVLCLLQAARAAPRWPAAPRPPPRAVEGLWEPLSQDERTTRGRLVGAPRGTPRVVLPAGAARAGERLCLLAPSRPAEPARGPAPAARTTSGSVRAHPDELVRLAPPAGALRTLRVGLAQRCDRLGDEPVAGLARALLLGDRSRLPAPLGDTFTRTGVRHLLAVSGLHVGLFATLLAGPGAWLIARLGRGSRARRRDRARALAALGLLAFAPLAGGAPPVRRAALAACAGLIAPLVPSGRGGREGRAVDGLSLWSAALVLELAIDPLAALAVGVQLSYAATLGLIVGTRPLERGLARGIEAGPPRLDRGALGRWIATGSGRLVRAVRTTLAASCTATLATLPIVWSRFGEWSPHGVLLTPLALLELAWILPAGWISLAAPESLGPTLFAPAVRALVALVRWADGLPGTPCALPERPQAALLAASALALAALRSGPCVRRGAALAWGLLLLPWTPAPAGLELVALDVGHGTALALRAPGAGVWVFDAGSRDRRGVGPLALGPLLARWDPGRVAVVLSHDQVDHAGGLGWIVERRPPWLWAGALPAPLGERLPHTTRRLDATAGRVELPVPRSSGGLSLALLRGLARSGNEGSRSLLVAWQGHRALLSGDAEQEGLRALLARGDLIGPLEVLVAPHHGSHTPWLGALLDATRPREVWVSAPGRPPVAEELARRRIAWRSTGLEGPLLRVWDHRGDGGAIRWHANR